MSNKLGFAPVLALFLVFGLALGAGVTTYLVSNRNASYNVGSQAKSNASEFAQNRTATPPGYYKDNNPGTVQRTYPVTGKSDLQDIQSDLDKSNPDELNVELNANDADAGSF